MKTNHLPLLMAVVLLSTSMASAETRVWTNSSGRKVEATFIKLEGDHLTIQVANGAIFTLPISRFSAEDQAAAKTMKPSDNANALMSVPTNASAADAAAKIDQLVEMGIQKANPRLAEAHRKNATDILAKSGKQLPPFTLLKPNEPMSDEQFVRRVYLDIVGRIPSYDETNEFLKTADLDKTARAKLIDTLLASDGYTSHMYNYLADMLRLTDNFKADFVRGLPYIKWMKEQVATNTTWDKMVYEMLTAKGKLWHNGAAGYLLRDSGMPLDNLANTLTVFLGTDVSCAQCHDHPFSDWTQRQFYEMAAFFGATSTQMGRSDYEGGKNGPNPGKKLLTEAVAIMEKNKVDPQRYRTLVQVVLGANRFVVNDVSVNRLKLPHDYQYKDGTPGDSVAPKLIMWNPNVDKKNPAYAIIGDTVRSSKREEGGVKNAENLRDAFAKWTTHPSNPRFAMTIANRLWERAFGIGLTPTVRNIDKPDEAYNPELLRHLANEMVRVKFNLKEYLRIIYNTKAYQRESTTAELAMGEPYYFQGPMLRRMSAEQAWDSYMTLLLGSNLDKLKNTDSEPYGRAIDMDINTIDAQTMLQKINSVKKLGEHQREKMRNAGSLAMAGSDTMMENASPLSYGGMVLMRASELPQPAPGGHFLREFGQSDRMLTDGNSKEGSVPQVLMMMNGKAQEMLTNTDSLIFRNMNKLASPPERVEAMFLSIFNRRPTQRENDIAKRALAEGDDGYASMIWALINTREFSFVQ